MFNNVDPQGNPTSPIVNQLVNFGWEYVYHCHILSHEEMDMMRPVSVALPPNAPGTPTFTFTGSGNNQRIVRHLERQFDQRDLVPGPADRRTGPPGPMPGR